jgi:signal transduction histidine kinase
LQKSAFIAIFKNVLNQLPLIPFYKFNPAKLPAVQPIGQALSHYWEFIKSIGTTSTMEEYEKRRLSIFNQLNFFSMVAGLILTLAGIFSKNHLPPLVWYVVCSPLAIGVIVLWLTSEQYYEASRLIYFSVYPIVTCLVYLGKVDAGVSLFFILYGVMAVFFLQRFTSIIFAFCWSAACYIVATVVPHNYYFRLATENYSLYIFHHITALGFIFYTLFLIKKENTNYQFSILRKGRELHRRNLEIERQRQVIADKATLLEQQTKELTELNQVKNKLFSVIAHDLKTPMYAMRNLFYNMQRYNLSAEEIKDMMPGIASEMTYTTSLMENLLQWAKTQMKHASVNPEVLDVQRMVDDVLQLLKLQADNKQVYLESRMEQPLFCYADREMVNLVLRNLLSNAIKFTPEHGKVSIGATQNGRQIEVFVKDTGIGISNENIHQLFGDNYYTTRGTNHETGTGLGLKLCKEFLEKNGGNITVQSERGKGSTFTFTLPRYENQVA